MVRILIVLAAGGLVILPGICHGVWTGRWQKSQDVQAAVDRLDRVPSTIGDWKGRPAELSKDEVQSAGVDGYLMRRYENPRKGTAVAVVLLCGRPGPTSIHTPDVCYRGAGYEMAGGLARLAKPFEACPQPAEFYAAKFQKSDGALTVSYRVLWGWSATGAWSAPANPRLVFSRHPALYKLYVIREMGRADETLEDDPCVELIRLLLPELQKALFEPS